MPRSPETWIEPDGPKGTYAELIDLRPTDSGLRPQIPSQARAVVNWLRGWAGGFALVELAEPGRIRIHDWKHYGERLLSRRQELLARSDEHDLIELIALSERYRRVMIEKSGRFALHQREQFHLGLSRSSSEWSTLLVCSPEQIELWNEEFRRHWRDRNQLDLSWLHGDGA